MPAPDPMRCSQALIGTVYLGTGGRSPGFHAFNCATREIRLLAQYPDGDSVYGIFVGEKWGVTGTRGGRVDLFAPISDGESCGCAERTTLRECGDQVTAVVETPAGAIVVADTAGTYLWPTPARDPGRHLKLDAQALVICAMCSSLDLTFGLARTGHILTWRIPEGDLVSCVAGPPPGPKAALSRLVPFGPDCSVAYLASGGGLVRYWMKTGTIDVSEAHKGEAYAVMLSSEYLATVGRDDARMSLWKPESGTPHSSFNVPCGVIAGAFVPSLVLSVVLIDDRGDARIYELRDGCARIVQELPGGDYRSIAGLSQDQMQEVEKACRDAEIRRIAQVLLSGRGEMAEGQSAVLHDQLRQLGAEAVSLEILAQQATERVTADSTTRVQELYFRHKQKPLLRDTPDSLPALQRLTETYESFWLLEEALRVREQVMRLSPTPLPLSLPHDRWLLDSVKAIQEGSAVIELNAACPLNAYLDAKDVVGDKAAGRFAIGNMAPLPYCGIDFGEAQLKEAFQEAWTEIASQSFPIPQTTVEEVSWISSEHVNCHRVFFVTAPFDFGGPVVSIAFPLRLGTTQLTTAIILTAHDFFATPCAEFNGVLRKAFLRIGHEGSGNSWFKSAWNTMARTVARVSAMQIDFSITMEGRHHGYKQ
jgi:hypothetical protein